MYLPRAHRQTWWWNFNGLHRGEGFPAGSVVKNLSANARDASTIPVSGRSPREGNGNSLWYSCLENPMDGGAWQATTQGAKKSRTQLKWLSTHSVVSKLWSMGELIPTACFRKACEPRRDFTQKPSSALEKKPRAIWLAFHLLYRLVPAVLLVSHLARSYLQWKY